MGARNGKLNSLIGANGPAKDDALCRVLRRLSYEPPAVANTLSRNQNSFGIHTVEDVPESLALFPNEGLLRQLQVVDEDFGCRVIHHRLDRSD